MRTEESDGEKAEEAFFLLGTNQLGVFSLCRLNSYVERCVWTGGAGIFSLPDFQQTLFHIHQIFFPKWTRYQNVNTDYGSLPCDFVLFCMGKKHKTVPIFGFARGCKFYNRQVMCISLHV